MFFIMVNVMTVQNIFGLLQPKQLLPQQQQHGEPVLGNQFLLGEGGSFAPVGARGYGSGDDRGFRPGIKAVGPRGFGVGGDSLGRQMPGEADKLRMGAER